MEHLISIRVNGAERQVRVDSGTTLLEAIRDILNLTGTKQGCGNGECGACTVIMNGSPVRACLVLAAEAEGADIITIEGVSGDGILTPLQKAFIEEGAIQCGFCTPGFIMAGEALFSSGNIPSDEDIRNALGGHLCRCTGYENIFRAFKKTRDYYSKRISNRRSK